MPHPSKYKASTGQCWECGSYSIEIPGGAFCKHHKTFFPNQFGWAVEGEEGTKAGERTCKFWKAKIIKVKKFKKELLVRDIIRRLT
jgi:hypothetical protein